MILFTSLVWTERRIITINDSLASSIESLYKEGKGTHEAIMELEDKATAQIILAAIILVLIIIVTQIIMLFVFRFVRKREALSRQKLGIAEDMVNRDALTGVKSKHAYLTIEHRYSHLMKEGNCPAFALALCDVNDLKSINDREGHDAGDALIKEACKLICTTFCHSPVFRIGGDEFVVLLDGEDYENRETLYKEIHSIVEKNSFGTGLVISIGMVDYEPGSNEDFLSLFHRADEAMYEVKAALKANRPEGFSLR